jgi:hypothetical protein
MRTHSSAACASADVTRCAGASFPATTDAAMASALCSTITAAAWETATVPGPCVPGPEVRDLVAAEREESV